MESSDRAHQPEIEGIRGRRPLNVPCRMRCDGSMERLEFRLLGFPEFRINGRRVDLGLRKAVALLILLAESSRPVARESVAALLWPDAETSEARARLRRTLHKVGIAFGGQIITANGASLGLDPVLSTDVDSRSFERDCDCRAFEKGVDLYNGDFLSGFALPDCPEFEEWAFFRREALRSRLVQALERLTEAKISTGEPRTGAVHAIRLVGLDPLSESAHRHLIRAYLAAGTRRQPNISSKPAPDPCATNSACCQTLPLSLCCSNGIGLLTRTCPEPVMSKQAASIWPFRLLAAVRSTSCLFQASFRMLSASGRTAVAVNGSLRFHGSVA